MVQREHHDSQPSCVEMWPGRQSMESEGTRLRWALIELKAAETMKGYWQDYRP